MSVMFNNLEILPIGNANVAVVNNKLEITNMGNSGLDGFLIKLNNQPVHINFDNINFGVNGSIRNSLILKRGQNIYPFAQSNTFKDPITNKINFAYDFNYVTDIFEIWGSKNGAEVFSIQKDNPVIGNTPPANDEVGEEPNLIVWAAVAAVATCVLAAVAIYEAIKPSKALVPVTTTYPDGTKEDTFKYIEDPTPIDIEVDGQIYNVDEWGIRYTKHYSASEDIEDYEIIGNQVTCSGISSLTIESLTLV